MSLIECLMVALALAMDALAVSIIRGFADADKPRAIRIRAALIIGAVFGLFQAGMTLVGFFGVGSFLYYIMSIDHWVAFGLLSYIGISMIVSSQRDKEKDREDDKDKKDEIVKAESSELGVKTLISLALATSIDALAVGISFAAINTIQIYESAAIIGVVAFGISMMGFLAGGQINGVFGKHAEKVGGVVLILIGLKFLLNHYGIISF